SEGSAPLFREGAARNAFGLVFEPSFPDGNLASARKGSGNFDVIVRGRAAHAGRDPHLGRNAIRAAADVVAALDALNGQRDPLTVNVGYVHGGGPTNIVPDLCIVKFNVRTNVPDDERWLRQQLDRVLADAQQREGIRLELRGSFTRGPKVMTPAIERLAGMIGDCGRQLGLDLEFRPTGGCCDGNNLAAAGLPNIDNLGVVGGEIHSDREFMRLSSLGERAQLSALLLLRLASGELTWTP
ncbi:MAG: peptidase dimerization domain-containing protein, partial [Gammaproteobacteria bacterium]